MKNTLFIKGRKALAVVASILGCGLVANIISDNVPVALVMADQGQVLVTNTENASEILYDAEVQSQKITDVRVTKIATYLSKRNAPLAAYAQEFVKAADYYEIDYRLVAAISIVESGGGRETFKPYNAWGWGKSGFITWEDGIWTVTQGLAKYYDLGLTTPKSISKSYCPPSSNAWASKVQYVMNSIEAM